MEPAPRTRLVLIAIGAVAFVIVAGILASIGGPQGVGAAIASVAYVLVVAGLPVAAYLLAAIGLGRLFAPLTRESSDAEVINAALGVATMLWVSSALGSLYLDVSIVGRVIAGAPVAIGLGLLILSMRKATIVGAPAWALALPATLLVAAAANPPGWLWASEFGGFDALSYHLQLPQEWLALGRIAPFDHNVYSFLPGYVGGAFAHVAVLAGVERPFDGRGLLTGEGLAPISCQLLHAGLAVFSAWLVGKAARAAAMRSGWSGLALVGAEAGAGLLFLATPWVIVAGSLAYNEMGVTAMLAGALIVAMSDLKPWMRGAAAGWLIGMACGAKPTALFLAGVPLGIVLFGLTPARAWAWCALAGCVAGLIALAPWLVRNAIESGNPVFPYATSLFGEAHWTSEQVTRFSSHHAFQGGLVERLSLMVVPDPDDPAGARHRGLMHPQWQGFFPLAVIGAGVALAGRWRNKSTWLLVLMLMSQLVLWLAMTHVQSRFLLPLAVTGSVLFGLGAARAISLACGKVRWVGLGVAGLCVVIQGGASLWIFSVERGGRPNARLTAAPSMLAGVGLEPDVAVESPYAFINALPADAGVYLLGDATPFYFTHEVIYNTTWDAWPLGEAVRAHPGDPGAWTQFLIDEGVDYLVVDEIGLGLSWKSGTADPDVTRETVDAWLADPSLHHERSWQAKHLFRLEAP